MTKRRPRYAEPGAFLPGVSLRLPALALVCTLTLVCGQARAELPLQERLEKSPWPAAPIRESALREGLASFYGGKFHGRLTASGERFDKHRHSAASNHFPLGTWLAVRRSENGQCTVLRVNDRMSRRQQHRILDLSKSAARYLDMLRAGVSRVQVVVLSTEFQTHWQQSAEMEKSASCHAAFAPVSSDFPASSVDLDDFNALPPTVAGLLDTKLPVVQPEAALPMLEESHRP